MPKRLQRGPMLVLPALHAPFSSTTNFATCPGAHPTAVPDSGDGCVGHTQPSQCTSKAVVGSGCYTGNHCSAGYNHLQTAQQHCRLR
jgi:hypothetical protein